MILLLLGIAPLALGIMLSVDNFFGAILTKTAIYNIRWGRVRRVYWGSVESINTYTVNGQTTIQIEYLSDDCSKFQKINTTSLSDMENLNRMIHKCCEDANLNVWKTIETNMTYWFFQL